MKTAFLTAAAILTGIALAELVAYPEPALRWLLVIALDAVYLALIEPFIFG